MNLFYIVDRTFTTWLIRFETWLRLRLNFDLLRDRLWIIGCLVIGSYYAGTKVGFSFESKMLYWLPVALIGIIIFQFTIMAIMKALHRRLDSEGANEPNRLYGKGYWAWTSVLRVIVLIALSLILRGSDISAVLYSLGFVGIYETFEAFIRRTHGDNTPKGM